MESKSGGSGLSAEFNVVCSVYMKYDSQRRIAAEVELMLDGLYYDVDGLVFRSGGASSGILCTRAMLADFRKSLAVDPKTASGVVIVDFVLEIFDKQRDEFKAGKAKRTDRTIADSVLEEGDRTRSFAHETVNAHAFLRAFDAFHEDCHVYLSTTE